MGNKDNQDLMQAIGEIKDIAVRIDKNTNSLNERLDELESDIKSIRRNSIIAGGLAGGIIAVGTEFIRIKLGF